jgi:hypothetical protein
MFNARQVYVLYSIGSSSIIFSLEFLDSVGHDLSMPVFYCYLQLNVCDFLPYSVCKKRLVNFFLSLAGMSLTNSPWPGIILLFLARESLVSDILAGDGKISNLLYSVMPWNFFSWSGPLLLFYPLRGQLSKCHHNKKWN